MPIYQLTLSGENLREETFANLSRIYKIKSSQNAGVLAKIRLAKQDSCKKISKKNVFFLSSLFYAFPLQ